VIVGQLLPEDLAVGPLVASPTVIGVGKVKRGQNVVVILRPGRRPERTGGASAMNGEFRKIDFDGSVLGAGPTGKRTGYPSV